MEPIVKSSAGLIDVLGESNWKEIDVIASFDYRVCADSVTQELLKVGDTYLWQFRTNDDSCDGGNSYGAIYSYDLSTPIAHIYDSDLVCDGWREEYRAENHKCDLLAENSGNTPSS